MPDIYARAPRFDADFMPYDAAFFTPHAALMLLSAARRCMRRLPRATIRCLSYHTLFMPRHDSAMFAAELARRRCLLHAAAAGCCRFARLVAACCHRTSR